ncbi:MAG: GxxExxY protein [Kiritimatiellae bacterium]|nr:GxxExxY protein [Kiritimatiellia bacterium]
MIEQQLTKELIGAAIEVHKHWGPGLYESVYEKSFCKELSLRKLSFDTQTHVPLLYKGEVVGDELIYDVRVEKKVMIENKHVPEILPIHEAQLLTYMKLTGCRVGIIFNYKVPRLANEGIRRMVLGLAIITTRYAGAHGGFMEASRPGTECREPPNSPRFAASPSGGTG